MRLPNITSQIEKASNGIDKIRFFYSQSFRTLFNSECDMIIKLRQEQETPMKCELCYELIEL